MKPSPELREFLAAVYDNIRSDERAPNSLGTYETRRRDFVFHMIDGMDDFERLLSMYRKPGDQDIEKCSIQIMGILFHLVPHLKTAGRLLNGRIEDPFAPKKRKPAAKKPKKRLKRETA